MDDAEKLEKEAREDAGGERAGTHAEKKAYIWQQSCAISEPETKVKVSDIRDVDTAGL